MAAWLSLTAIPTLAQQWKLQDFKELAPVKGIWIASLPNNKQYLETWAARNDTLLEGRSFYITKEQKQVPAETVQLVYSRGTIRYIVTTVGQNEEQPVAFTLVRKEGRSFTFENKAHDFPQQISYRFPQRNKMKATISGTTAKGPVSMDFNFVKITGRKFER